MDRLRTAEWILSLVFPPDRAASIAGDLSESPLRFWSDVIATTLAGLRKGFTDRPVSLIGFAVRGFILSTLASLSGLCVATVLMLPWAIVFGLFSVLNTPAPAWLRETSVIYSVLAIIAAQFLTQFQVGGGIARRARGRELAAAIAICLPMLLSARITLVEANPLILLWQGSTQSPDLSVAVCRILFVLAITTGAISARRKGTGTIPA